VVPRERGKVAAGGRHAKRHPGLCDAFAVIEAGGAQMSHQEEAMVSLQEGPLLGAVPNIIPD